MLVAFGLRVACALLFNNVNSSDEIFQYVEPAHRAVFGYGLLAWEFQRGTRSWFVPGFVAAIIKLTSLWSDDPAVYLGAIGMVMSALSLSVVVVAFLWGQLFYGFTGAVITASLAGSWFELIYFAPKPLTDVLASDALVVAAFLVYPKVEHRSRKAFFLCGLCLGLAFALRWQLAPVYLLISLYVCRGWIRERWLPLIVGGAVPVLAWGFLDAATWSYPFQSILLPLSMGYHPATHDPWYYYAGVLTLNWSGAVVPLLGLAYLGARRMPFLGMLVSFILIAYSLLETKAYRYIYPALPFLIILAGLGTSDIVVRLQNWRPQGRLAFAVAAVGGWLLTSAALAVNDHFRIYLTKDGAIVDAFDQIGRRVDLCGLAVAGLESWRTAGYTHLHRDVPIYLIPSDEIARRADSFNYLVGPPNRVGTSLPFARESCAPNAGFSTATGGEICIYHRPGGCVLSTERTMEGTL